MSLALGLLTPRSPLPASVRRLAWQARGEGFGFGRRLLEEWETGRNRFARPREFLLLVRAEGRPVGFGGLNVDPFQGSPWVGRVRHLYLEPAWRRRGAGGALLREILRRARPGFRSLRLRTRDAGSFYERHGFLPVAEPESTHRLGLLP